MVEPMADPALYPDLNPGIGRGAPFDAGTFPTELGFSPSGFDMTFPPAYTMCILAFKSLKYRRGYRHVHRMHFSMLKRKFQSAPPARSSKIWSLSLHILKAQCLI